MSAAVSTPQPRPTIVRGRFAPSPTGPLHLGGARTALCAWLSVRARGGSFVLRMEDLDAERARAGAADALLEDLRWLGLDWDEGPDAGVGGPYAPYTQGLRRARYADAAARLRAAGLSYPCFCTRAELARAASAPHPGETAPAYPGSCRSIAPADAAARVAAGARAALRLRVPAGERSFDDLVRGAVTQDIARAVGDFAIVRADGCAAYQLAVALDDAEMAITEVLRADDLVDSTPRQLLVLELLGLPAPRYAHVPLVLAADGVRLAKRDGAAQVPALRAAGRTPAEVVGFLGATLGLCPRGSRALPAELLPAWRTHADLRWLAQPPTRLAAGPDPLAENTNAAQ